jgi:D-alanine-D-alanine ligase
VRIGLTYNLKPANASGDQFEEFDSIETIEALEAALRAYGHQPVRLGWGAPMLDALRATPVDGVFNLAEGVGGRGRESQVPAVLEMLGVPCTASDALAIGITLDKPLAKLMAKAHDIATAPWMTVGPLTPTLSPQAGRGSWEKREPSPREAGSGWREAPGEGLRFPLFVKPAAEGSSMGITSKSICRNERELDDAIARVTKYGPVLVEEFLSGDEFTVGIIDGEVIGVMQVVPRKNRNEFIYSLEVKRDYQSNVEYRLVDEPRAAAVALAIWNAFGLRDVARVDVRCDRDDVPNFVEVNPLPGMNPVTSDLVILSEKAGWTYNEVIGGIMQSAEERWRAA